MFVPTATTLHTHFSNLITLQKASTASFSRWGETIFLVDTTDIWLSSSGQHTRQNSGFMEIPRIVLKVIMLMMELTRWPLLAKIGSLLVKTAERGGSLYHQLYDFDSFNGCWLYIAYVTALRPIHTCGIRYAAQPAPGLQHCACTCAIPLAVLRTVILFISVWFRHGVLNFPFPYVSAHHPTKLHELQHFSAEYCSWLARWYTHTTLAVIKCRIIIKNNIKDY